MLQHIGTLQWAVTINPSPNKLMNRKRYQLYSNAEQERILSRIIERLMRDNPSIVCIEKHYERCPSNGQIHLHALFEFSCFWHSTFETYINRVIQWKEDKSNPPWRHLDIQHVHDKEQWLLYIRKEADKL